MKYIIPTLFLLTVTPELPAQTISVGLGGDFPTLSAAESSINAGDTVLVLDGVYSDGTQFLEDLNGTLSEPIVIMSANRHGAAFRGGTEAIHLVNCSHLELRSFVIEQQSGNGINIDDGGDYSTPTHHITVYDCCFRDMAGSGNNDFLKLSGLDDFLIKQCTFVNGSTGGSGIDMVGCHQGVIEDNYLDQAGTTGIQAKGGTQFITIQRNILKDMDQRALNLGGSTGLQFFRPPLHDPIVDAFEAADLEVYSNVFVGSWSPIAFVGCVRVKVVNNTIYEPENWVIRILQETTEPGFLACSDNEFRNNIVFQATDLTEVNIGPNTSPSTFIFTNNLWHNNASMTWSPVLPVIDSNQVIANPLFTSALDGDFQLPPNSPAVAAGKDLSDPQFDFVQRSFYSPPSCGAFEGNESITSAPYLIQDDCIMIGPNPSSSLVTIDGNFTNATIHVLDNNGSLVQDYSNAAAPLEIDLNGLPNGLYFIHLQKHSHPKLQIQRILKVAQ